MCEEPTDLNADRDRFAAQLAGWVPRAAAIDREQLLFAAGRTAALADARRRRRWLAWSQPIWAALFCSALVWRGGLIGTELDRSTPLSNSAITAPANTAPANVAPHPMPGAPRPNANPFIHRPDDTVDERQFASDHLAIETSADNYLRCRNQVVAELAQGSQQSVKPVPDAVPLDRNKQPAAEPLPRGPRQLLKDLNLL